MKITILGAGISGLSLAWFLKKKNPRFELTLLEKSSRPGGWIETVHQNGFLFENGPRGFRSSGKGQILFKLAQELELNLIEANPESRNRFIYLEGKLQRFSPLFLLKNGMLRAAFKDLRAGRCEKEDETLYAFFCRRFNERLAQNLIDPVVKGVFGGDIQKLSARSCFPLLWQFDQEKGSCIRGFLSRKKTSGGLYNFLGGMQELIQKLTEKLDAKIHFSHPVNSLDSIDADLIISTLPTHALAPLLGLKDPCNDYLSLSTVSLGWNQPLLKKQGYGFLIPSKEKADILGMTWDSSMFPQQNKRNQTRICIMIAGEHSPAVLHERALASVNQYLGIAHVPEAMSIHTAVQAIPQYTLYHHERIAAFQATLPARVKAIGMCFGGIGLNDSLYQAKSVVNIIE